MRKIWMVLVALGINFSLPCFANEGPIWSMACDTTGLVKWNFNRTDRSVSTLRDVKSDDTNHLLFVSENGHVIKTTVPGVSSFSFFFLGAKDFSVDINENYIHFVSHNAKNESFVTLSPFNSLHMSKGHLRMKTKHGEFNLNFIANKKIVSGVQLSSSDNTLHTFECNNVSESRWNNLFNIMRSMTEGFPREKS